MYIHTYIIYITCTCNIIHIQSYKYKYYILQYTCITLCSIGIVFFLPLCMIGFYIYILVSHTHCIAVNDVMTFQRLGQLIGMVYRRMMGIVPLRDFLPPTETSRISTLFRSEFSERNKSKILAV